MAETYPEPIGFERVFDGGCDHCAVAAERLYFIEDLMPIHEHCGCGVSPVFSDDGRLFHTREDLGKVDDEIGARLDQTEPVFATEQMVMEQFGSVIEADQMAAMADYASSASFRINADLRAGGAGGRYHEVVRDLDKAMRPLKADTKVYRGVDMEFEEVFGFEPEVGGIIQDEGFLSTTWSKKIADDFALDGEGVRIDIVVPKGTLARPLSSAVGTGEGELVIGRGSRLQITKVISRNHVEARIIPSRVLRA